MYAHLTPETAASLFYLVSCFCAVLAAFVSLMFGVRS
jgi:hypothetical protein